jgi:hypothetical protein
MAVTRARPDTGIGVDESVVVPLPSSPPAFDPQQTTPPFARSAQLCSWLVATATALLRLDTVTGVDESVVVPSPS